MKFHTGTLIVSIVLYCCSTLWRHLSALRWCCTFRDWKWHAAWSCMVCMRAVCRWLLRGPMVSQGRLLRRSNTGDPEDGRWVASCLYLFILLTRCWTSHQLSRSCWWRWSIPLGAPFWCQRDSSLMDTSPGLPSGLLPWWQLRLWWNSLQKGRPKLTSKHALYGGVWGDDGIMVAPHDRGSSFLSLSGLIVQRFGPWITTLSHYKSLFACLIVHLWPGSCQSVTPYMKAFGREV